MRCTHCAAAAARTDWFCSNCKRSRPRPGRSGLPGSWMAATIAAGLAVGVAFSRYEPVRPTAPAEYGAEAPLHVRVSPLREPVRPFYGQMLRSVLSR